MIEDVVDPAVELTKKIAGSLRQHIEEMTCAWVTRTGNMDPQFSQIVFEPNVSGKIVIRVEHRDARLCKHYCERCGS